MLKRQEQKQEELFLTFRQKRQSILQRYNNKLLQHEENNFPDDSTIKRLWENNKNDFNNKKKKSSSSTHSTLRSWKSGDDNDALANTITSVNENVTGDASTGLLCDTGIVHCNDNKNKMNNNSPGNSNSNNNSTMIEHEQRKLSHSFNYTNFCTGTNLPNNDLICDCSNFNTVTTQQQPSGLISCVYTAEYCYDYNNKNDCGTISITYSIQYNGQGLHFLSQTVVATKGDDTIEFGYTGQNITSLTIPTRAIIDGCDCMYVAGTCAYEEEYYVTRLVCPGLPAIDTCAYRSYQIFWNLDPVCDNTSPNVPTITPSEQTVTTIQPVPEEETQTNKGNTGTNVALIGGAIGAAIAVLLLIACVYIYCKRKKAKQSNDQQDTGKVNIQSYSPNDAHLSNSDHVVQIEGNTANNRQPMHLMEANKSSLIKHGQITQTPAVGSPVVEVPQQEQPPAAAAAVLLGGGENFVPDYKDQIRESNHDNIVTTPAAAAALVTTASTPQDPPPAVFLGEENYPDYKDQVRDSSVLCAEALPLDP